MFFCLLWLNVWKMFYAETIHNGELEVRNMAKCPECGKDVKTAKKQWKMAGKPDKAGKRTQLTIGLFECCGKTFRQVLEKKKI
jgi:hypothetical protein